MEQIEEIGSKKSLDKHVAEEEESSVQLSSCVIGSDVSHVGNSDIIGNTDGTGKNSDGCVETMVRADPQNDLLHLKTANASEEKSELQESQECYISKTSPSGVTADAERIIDPGEACENECVLEEKIKLRKDDNDEGSMKETSGKEQSDSFPLKELTECGQGQLDKGDSGGEDMISLDVDLPAVNPPNTVLKESTEDDKCPVNPFRVISENKERQSKKESELETVTPSTEMDVNNIALPPCELQNPDELDECIESSGESKELDQHNGSENAIRTTASICESDLRPTDESLTKTTVKASEETNVESSSSSRVESDDVKNTMNENKVRCELSDDSQRVDFNLEKEAVTHTSSVLNAVVASEHNTSPSVQENEQMVKDMSVDSQATFVVADISNTDLNKKDPSEEDADSDVMNLDERLVSGDEETSNAQKSPVDSQATSEVADISNTDLNKKVTSEKDTDSDVMHLDERLESGDKETSNVQKSSEGESQIGSNVETEKFVEVEQGDVEMSDSCAGKSDNEEEEDPEDADKNEEFFKKVSEDADMNKEIEKDSGENSCDMQESVEFVQIDSDKDEYSQQSLDRTDEDADPAADKDPFAISNDKDSIANSNEEVEDSLAVSNEEDKNVIDGAKEEEEGVIGGANEEYKDDVGVADERKKDVVDADENVEDVIGVADEVDNNDVDVADEEDKDVDVTDEEDKDVDIADEEDKDVDVADEDDKDVDVADEEDKDVDVTDEDKDVADEDKDVDVVDEDKDVDVVDEEKDVDVVDEEKDDVADEDKDVVDIADDKDVINIADEDSIAVSNEEDKDSAAMSNEEDKSAAVSNEENKSAAVSNEEDTDSAAVSNEENKDSAAVSNEEGKDFAAVSNDKDKSAIVSNEEDTDSTAVSNEEGKDFAAVSNEEEKNSAAVSNEKDKDTAAVSNEEDKDSTAVSNEEVKDSAAVLNKGDKDSADVSNEDKDSVAASNEEVKDTATVSSEVDKVSVLIQNEEKRASVAAPNGEDEDDLIMEQETNELPMEVDDTGRDDTNIADIDPKTTDDMEEPGGVDISEMCETVLEESTSTLPLKTTRIASKRPTKPLESGDDTAEIVEIIDTADTEKENEKQRHPSKNKSGVMKRDGKSKNVKDSASHKQANTAAVNDDEEICIIPDTMPRVMPGNKETKGKGETLKGRRVSKSNEITAKVNEKPEVPRDASESRRTPGRPQRQAAKRAECQIKELAANEECQEPEERVGGARICDGCFKLRNWVTSYKIQTNGTEKIKYFCSQDCASNFKRMSRTKPSDTDVNSNAEPVRRFTRKCAQCSLVISGEEKNLSWETMDFCNEECLGRYQKILGSQCANCKGIVASASLGKYCVRFGYDVKQFCCSGCLEEFKKGLKVCSYCQKDISGGSEGFLAPVGDKGQFKDFCTQSCMEKYDQMSNNHAPPVIVQECAVCNNEKVVSMEVIHKKRVHKFCSEPCFAAFRFVNGMVSDQCYMCKKFFDKKEVDNFAVYSDDLVHSFCSKTCMNVYILANRKIVPCHWCKVKKYNFDMIKRVYNTGQLLLVCSLNCLSLYQVGVNAVSTKRITCDFCNGMCSPQYNLNMSDNTVRNFCCYQCVMKFQEQFSSTVRVDSSPFPTGGPKRYIGPRRSLAVQQNETQRGAKTGVPLPVISSVQSLAGDDPSAQNNAGITTRSAAALKQVNNNVPQNAVQPSKVVRQIIVRPPAPKPMRNKAVTCRPTTHTKGTHCRPIICSKETQTESSNQGQPVLIPVPVPIYVPTPMCMYSSPFPVPVPFPLPVPVPIFIPTTRNSAKGIMKEIKRIQEKIPADPFEAELLMMAEIVAGEKKGDNSDSDSDAVDNTDVACGAGEDAEEGPRAAVTDGRYSPETVDSSNTFGDDMLQMALKMATELEEPTDLEAALTPTTITSQPATSVEQTNSESEDDPEPVQPAPEVRPLRGRKRPIRTLRSTASATTSSTTSTTTTTTSTTTTTTSSSGANKRRRVSASGEGLVLPPPEPPQPPVVEQEKADANMCLKFTLGVNAWKRWVLTKNAELEKAAASNRKLKLFKPEILQQTADELNYSLCLFVKEVRKPNGQEYAPDTIYYLCLGIQQYLFESGRIDNIFTDPYYEKFTECLDEVAKKFSTLYNDSQYIVTRVEEEHLWESKQLGAHSPHVLLSTLMFFNTKHFNLTTVEEHMQLSFSHIMKHWKRNPNQSGASKGPGGTSRNVLLRFYPPQSALEGNSKKKKVYEQQENEDNPLRCPVKLYEFYLSKCPESVKTRNDVFYLLPERSCVPDSPVWYSTMALGKEPLMKMLHRVRMVKEINQALLKS